SRLRPGRLYRGDASTALAVSRSPTAMRIGVCAAVGACRLVELVWSTRNLGAAGVARRRRWNERIFPLMAALHAAIIIATALRGGRPRFAWLAVLLAVQPIRYWALLSL